MRSNHSGSCPSPGNRCPGNTSRSRHRVSSFSARPRNSASDARLEGVTVASTKRTSSQRSRRRTSTIMRVASPLPRAHSHTPTCHTNRVSGCSGGRKPVTKPASSPPSSTTVQVPA